MARDHLHSDFQTANQKKSSPTFTKFQVTLQGRTGRGWEKCSCNNTEAFHKIPSILLNCLRFTNILSAPKLLSNLFLIPPPSKSPSLQTRNSPKIEVKHLLRKMCIQHRWLQICTPQKDYRITEGVQTAKVLPTDSSASHSLIRAIIHLSFPQNSVFSAISEALINHHNIKQNPYCSKREDNKGKSILMRHTIMLYCTNSQGDFLIYFILFFPSPKQTVRRASWLEKLPFFFFPTTITRWAPLSQHTATWRKAPNSNWQDFKMRSCQLLLDR